MARLRSAARHHLPSGRTEVRAGMPYRIRPDSLSSRLVQTNREEWGGSFDEAVLKAHHRCPLNTLNEFQAGRTARAKTQAENLMARGKSKALV